MCRTYFPRYLLVSIPLGILNIATSVYGEAPQLRPDMVIWSLNIGPGGAGICSWVGPQNAGGATSSIFMASWKRFFAAKMDEQLHCSYTQLAIHFGIPARSRVEKMNWALGRLTKANLRWNSDAHAETPSVRAMSM